LNELKKVKKVELQKLRDVAAQRKEELETLSAAIVDEHLCFKHIVETEAHATLIAFASRKVNSD
jgi:hypothetical protein